MSPVEDQPNKEATTELIVGNCPDKDKTIEIGECGCSLPGPMGMRCNHCSG